MNRKTAISTAAALIAALTLTGCAAYEPQLEPWAIDIPTAPPTAPAEPDLVAVPDDAAAGDTISEDLARELNRDLRDGHRGYELSDGTFVLVKQNEPLPPAVKADAETQAAAVPVVTGTTPEDYVASAEGGLGLANNLSFLTGKRVVAIVYGVVAFPGFRTEMAWRAAQAPLNADGLYPIGTDLNAVIAETEALIAQQENPAEWEIVVQPR